MRGLYRGFGVFLVQESVGRSTYFVTYETAKLVIGKLRTTYGDRGTIDMEEDFHNIWSWEDPRRWNAHHNSVSTRMMAAMCAGIVAWFIAYPLDVIKSRLQLDFERKKYQTAGQCLRVTFEQGGLRGLYRGLGYTLLRAAPVAATILPIYEWVRDAIDLHMDHH